VQAAFRLSPSGAAASATLSLQKGRVQEMPATKAFPAFFISSMVLHPRASRGGGGSARRLVAPTASLSRAIACQHFFKPDAVFFGALVYSRSSASRFPNARSD
jgi:hypothetical protein